jgi:fumarylacetoacetate (FAA) hydrolase family protein
MKLNMDSVLPQDKESATLVGRAWLPGQPGGPSPVALREGSLYDLSAVSPTSSALLNCADPVRVVRDAIARGWAKPVADAAAAIENSHADRRDPARPYILAPCDLQAVRACGVTFVSSMVERVIE